MARDEQERYAIALKAALELFENEDDAVGWLNEPSYPLGDVTPASLLITDDGLRLVLYEIGQMEFGHPI